MLINTTTTLIILISLLCANATHGQDVATPVTSLRPDLSMREVERAFKNPPNEFRITQYGLSGRTLAQYPEYGIGGTMAFLFDWMYRSGPSGPRAINPIIEKARAAEYKVWLADDSGYPSGMAGGRVVQQHPEVEVRSLVMVKQSGTGTTPISFVLPKELEDVVAAVLYPLVRREGSKEETPDYTRARIVKSTGREVNTRGMDGRWQLSVFARFLRNKNTQAQSTMAQFKHTGRFPDLMNDRAVASFIQNVHEPILAQITNPRGVIQGFYCNEPNLMQTCWETPGPYACLPWTADLPRTFKSMHGYDLTPRLAACFAGKDITARRTRIHYRQTVAELFSKNFARQIADWCEQRGIRSSGHLLLNQHLSQHVIGYGDMMKFASEFHVPALDIPIPNPDQYDGFDYEQTKLFSSIAVWKRRPDTIMLLDPIIGGYGHARLCPGVELLINSVNHAFYNGATIFTSYLPLEPRKNRNASGYEPKEFRFLNEYIGRLGMLLRGAKPASQIAFYYPIAMFQADVLPSNQRWNRVTNLHREAEAAWDDTQRALRDSGMQYTIVHPEAVAEAPVADGTFKVGDAQFRHLVVPHMEFLPLTVMTTIKRFEQSGGTVIWVGTVPNQADSAANTETIRRMTTGYSAASISQVTRLITTAYPPEVDLEFLNNPNELLVGRYLRGATPVYLVVNKTEKRVRVEWQPMDGEAAKVKVFDPSTGAIRTALPSEPIWLDGHRSLVITE